MNIVSGMEDMDDMESKHDRDLLPRLTEMYRVHYAFMRQRDNWPAMPLTEITRGITRSGLVAQVQEDFSLTPATAVNGLYVRTEPNLGLQWVPSS